MKKKYDVAAVGLQCVDIVTGPVPKDALIRELSQMRSTDLLLGGDALNQAVTAARLGGKTALIGCVGSDGFGDTLIEQLSAIPSLTVLDARTDGQTSVSIVLIDETGERHFLSHPESNRLLSYERIDLSAIRNAEIVSIGGCCYLPMLDGKGMLALLDEAHASGAETALDFRLGGQKPSEDYLKSLLRRADWVFPNENEAAALTGGAGEPQEMAEALIALGAKNCVIKLGGDGCYVRSKNFSGHVKACPAALVDATGAGDNFVGAFLHALTRKWNTETCARFACAAGAIAVERIGANGGVLSEAQVRERMERVYGR